MRLGWVQLLAGVGGVILPVFVLVRGIRSARTPLTPILAAVLLGVGVYVLAQTRFLTEIETAGDGLRLAAGGITIVGIVATTLFLAAVVGCVVVLFLFLWPVVLTRVGQAVGGLIRFLVNTFRSLFRRSE
jgi:hypothetical protein